MNRQTDLDRRRALWEPLSVGRKTMANRLVFGAWHTNLARHGRFSDAQAQFYARRAPGLGLMVLEEATVHPSDAPLEHMVRGEGADPGWERVVDAVRTASPTTLVVAALGHAGGQQDGSVSRSVVWAPSAVPDLASGVVPKVMEEEDMAAVAEGFAAAARRAVAAGVDGVEVNASHYALLRQFLSPLTNLRQDAWGKDAEGRLKFPLEVLVGVRRAIGEEAILGLRVTGDEYAPWGGLTPDTVADLVLRMLAVVRLDYLVVEVGSLYTPHLRAAGSWLEPDYAVEAALRIHQALRQGGQALPVIASGSLVDAEGVADALDRGVEAVEITRALIADPDWPKWAAEGKPPRMRCILCNQGCQVRSPQNPPLRCTVNPEAGREGVNRRAALTRPGRAGVIGGGPAGLSAAATLAEAGWSVELYEARMVLGGRMALAARTPARARWMAAIEDWHRRLAASGVTVHVGRPVQIEDFEAGRVGPFDCIVVATGSRWSPRPAWATAGPVVSPEALLEEGPRALSGRRWALVDLEEGTVAPAVARFLQAAGAQVTVVTQDLFFGRGLIAAGELVPFLQAFLSGQPTVWTRRVVRGLEPEAGGWRLVLSDRFTGEAGRTDVVDGVCLVLPEEPADDLYQALKAEGAGGAVVLRVGDAVAVRGIRAAVREGALLDPSGARAEGREGGSR
ncbi:MAG: NAD(P)-binding protein [Firmicutes bacterium]|nr:NAD(P)-binding protein [Alicyclobacillaceae bacterium]MCL6497531.1 NAD(P)-binding protein [Bacillota bacterium]